MGVLLPMVELGAADSPLACEASMPYSKKASLPWCAVVMTSTLSLAFNTWWRVPSSVVGVAMASCPLRYEASMLCLEEAFLPSSPKWGGMVA